MCTGSVSHKLILVVAYVVTNYLVTITLYTVTSLEIGEVLLNHVFCKHGAPCFDEDQAFSSHFMQYIYKTLGINVSFC